MAAIYQRKLCLQVSLVFQNSLLTPLCTRLMIHPPHTGCPMHCGIWSSQNWFLWLSSPRFLFLTVQIVIFVCDLEIMNYVMTWTDCSYKHHQAIGYVRSKVHPYSLPMHTHPLTPWSTRSKTWRRTSAVPHHVMPISRSKFPQAFFILAASNDRASESNRNPGVNWFIEKTEAKGA